MNTFQAYPRLPDPDQYLDLHLLMGCWISRLIFRLKIDMLVFEIEAKTWKNALSCNSEVKKKTFFFDQNPTFHISFWDLALKNKRQTEADENRPSVSDDHSKYWEKSIVIPVINVIFLSSRMWVNQNSNAADRTLQRWLWSCFTCQNIQIWVYVHCIVS